MRDGKVIGGWFEAYQACQAIFPRIITAQPRIVIRWSLADRGASLLASGRSQPAARYSGVARLHGAEALALTAGKRPTQFPEESYKLTLIGQG